MARYFWRQRNERGQQHGSMWLFRVTAEDRMKFLDLFHVEQVWITKRNGIPSVESPELEAA